MVCFEYLESKTLQKALALLSQHSTEARVVARDTDLLRALKDRILDPRYLININIKNIPPSVLVAPPIANAICDATGVRTTELPLTPERVFTALKAHKST